MLPPPGGTNLLSLPYSNISILAALFQPSPSLLGSICPPTSLFLYPSVRFGTRRSSSALRVDPPSLVPRCILLSNLALRYRALLSHPPGQPREMPIMDRLWSLVL